MIAMLDTNKDLDVCASEIGAKCEQLLTPLTRFNRTQRDEMFCIDNGAFSGFQVKPFESLLEREKEHSNQCRFVAVPDVVGSARRTVEVFHIWKAKLKGWRLAFVAQDGQENHTIPWDDVDALFVGGTTEWKLSKYAVECIRAAQCLGKWVHVGRINTKGRWEYFENLGADSCDGSGIARFSHMREKIGAMKNQLPLAL